jgi:Apea-like HEPN
MSDDDKQIVDAVLRLVGISDPLSSDGRLSIVTRNRLLKSAEWDLAADALEADAILGPVLNKRIGTDFWDTQLVLEAEVLYELVTAGAQAADPGVGIRQALASLRDRYRTTGVSVVSIEPITGIVIGTPIRLEENVELRQFSDREVHESVEEGRYSAFPWGGMSDVVRHGLVITTQVTRAITDPGAPSPRTIDSGVRSQPSRVTPREAVLAALRLHADNPRAISLTGAMTTGRGWGWGRAIHLGARWRPGYDPPLMISPDVAGRVSSDYPRIAKILVRPSNAVAVALRRYTTSHDRDQAEDRVIDLAIALEALFADGATELTYRLSVNGANYVSVPGKSRAVIRDWLKAAYACRSKVVHAKGKSAMPATRLLQDNMKGVDGLAADLAYFVRLALTTALSELGDSLPDQIADFGAMALRP